ncbi:hypothetical protein HispidOSU_019248 [Sigmodon hispidus]
MDLEIGDVNLPPQLHRDPRSRSRSVCAPGQQILSDERPLQFGTGTAVNRQERKPGTFSVNATFPFQETLKDSIQLLDFVLRESLLMLALSRGIYQAQCLWGQECSLGTSETKKVIPAAQC